MSKVTLPRTNQTGTNEWADVEANDNALAEVINGKLDNENIAASANIARSKLEGGAQGIAGTWYTPTIVATEQTRESATFGTLSTPDEITGVVVPTNGTIRVGFTAVWKSSVAAAGRAALTLNGAAIATVLNVSTAEESTVGTTFHALSTAGLGSGTPKILLTGAEVSSLSAVGASWVEIEALTAGTYSLAIQFRATSGSVTVKERKLKAEVHGF